MSKRPTHDPWADYKKFQESRWVNNYLPVNPARTSRFNMRDGIAVTLVLVAAAIIFKGSIIIILPVLLILWLCIGLALYRQRKAKGNDIKKPNANDTTAT
jgi:hypothetical protein